MTSDSWNAARIGRAIEDYIDRRPFTTAAGLRANQKIDLDRPRTTSPFFVHVVEEIGNWAVAQKVAVITGVPTGATRFAKAAARQFDIPFVAYRKREGVFQPYYDERHGLEIMNSDDETELVGIVEDVCSTRFSLARVAATIRHRKIGLAIVDRGEEVEGVSTVEQAQAYGLANPTLPPAHMSVSFPYESLLKYPLALQIEQR